MHIDNTHTENANIKKRMFVISNCIRMFGVWAVYIVQ